MSDRPDLTDLLRAALAQYEGGANRRKAGGKVVVVDVERLLQAYEQLTKKHTFKPGQLVTWKPGLKNFRRPNYDEPAVVVEVLEEPIYNTQDSVGSPYFRMPMDIVLGLIDEDGDFMMYHFDSRRFQPYKKSV
ncbi:MAG: hypothetical protein QXT73_02350 [Candidatus Methanomethylicaceae archaeon]